tara:strand:- start:99 stop:344 length:246 start_codon:yes stop_codon:yes gene_type:complete
MKYYYTPIFEDADEVLAPGKDENGTIVSAGEDLVAGISSPECDRGPDQRFVLVTPDSVGAAPGWTEKTKAEVNTDYPGLIP